MENNEGIKNPLSEMAEEVNDAIKDLPDDKKELCNVLYRYLCKELCQWQIQLLIK